MPIITVVGDSEYDQSTPHTYLAEMKKKAISLKKYFKGLKKILLKQLTVNLNPN